MSGTYSPYDDRYIRSQQTHMEHKTLTTCPVRTVLSLYYIPPPAYETNNTDHMSCTYSTIAILDPNTQISKHKLTTYPICPITILYPTTHMWITQY